MSTRVEQAHLAVRIDDQWRTEIKKKISEFAFAARLANRDALEQRNDPAFDRVHAALLGASGAYLACARRLKGLL